MKFTKLVVVLALAIVSCKKNSEKEPVEITDYKTETLDVTTSIYPENLTKVFDAHGGIDTWRQFQFLEFTMEKPDGNEITKTDLKNRKALIEMPNHTIGFDGENVWLNSKEGTEFKGANPKFYYNLMFYFYAMPFILADDGIIYGDAKPLEFEGKTYPGISISYHDGVGESSEDEYVLYYNPDTYRMEWLGYTVTFFTNEKGKELHFRRYNNWQEVGGVLLPKSIVRYKYANNLPTTVHSENHFSNIKISKEKPNQDIFIKPESAKIIE
ncbi:DUF6503 family protein [Seonamhaeicola sp.]|uniref:DUF6503 family protein n=1 Tax=Seonamhaeicola sp. TaxID=1912245 RepID=UPI003568BA56